MIDSVMYLSHCLPDQRIFYRCSENFEAKNMCVYLEFSIVSHQDYYQEHSNAVYACVLIICMCTCTERALRIQENTDFLQYAGNCAVIFLGRRVAS